MKHLPLKSKLFFVTLTTILLMAVIMIGQSYQGITELSDDLSAQTEQNLTSAVIERLEAETQAYGQQISGYINSAFRVSLTLASTLQHSITSPDAHLNRLQVHYLLRNTLTANSDISALYAHFEPNGYDNLDATLIGQNTAYSTESQGTLEDYWIHNLDNQVENIKVDNPEEKYFASKDEFGMRESEWYLCSHDSLKPCMLEPHFYQISETYKEMMTALIAPVVVNQQFRGVVGADINLPLFQTLSEQLSAALYNGQAQVTLLSQGGLIVAASHFKDKLRRPLSEAMPDLGDKLSKLYQNDGIYTSADAIFVSKAVHITTTDTNWSLLIELPKKVALAEIDIQQALAASKKSSVLKGQLLMGAGVALLSLIAIILLIRSITQPIGTLNQQVSQLASAEGDLSQSLSLDTHAELITLGSNFNKFIQKLRELVNSLKGVSQEVRNASAENLDISEQTTDATEHQQNEIDNVVTATQEMSATAAEVARIAAEVSTSTNDIKHNINDSQQELSKAVDISLELSDSMHSASSSIAKVSERSDDINRILTVIGGIAEQTNLLALNAAIEAARAGEQGRGFAVVADEVRTLASRTQASTEEINNLIGSLQAEVKQAVNIIENGSEQANNTMNTTRHAHTTLHTVVEAINDIADNIQQVATAAEEQSSVSEDITRNLTNIGDAAQVLAGLAARASSSSHQVTSQLDILDTQLNALRT